MKSVVIVGGGPASTYAVMACAELGIKPVVFIRSFNIQAGAFWFKWLPESLRSEFSSDKIHVGSVGSSDGYVKKQWGSVIPGYKSSFPSTPFEEQGYNPEMVMKHVLITSDMCESTPSSRDFTDGDLLRLRRDFDIVFHSFPTERAADSNKHLMIKFPVRIEDSDDSDNEVIYNGLPNSWVVRMSNLWGRRYAELPPVKFVDSHGDRNMVFPTDLKPFITPVECYPLSKLIVPIGRLARFDRKMQAHDNYELVLGKIKYELSI